MRAGRVDATLPFSPAAVFPDAGGKMEQGRVTVTSTWEGASPSLATHPHHLAPEKQPRRDDLGKKRPKWGGQRAWPDAEMEVTLLSSTFPNLSALKPASPCAPRPSHRHGLQGKVCHVSGK